MRNYALILTTLVLASPTLSATTKQLNAYYDKSLKELLNEETQMKVAVGSRNGERDMVLSEVPIDVITAEQIRQSGSSDLGEIIARFLPGFNSPHSSITDGTDHARPFTLRGLNPDQVLVLINGKRLHQSSLLNINSTVGRGSSGVDLATIPVAMVKKIEVLRDGAAAQYGSDAIAGVINITLKGYGEENLLTLSSGKTTQGDGLRQNVKLFYTTPLQYNGFINIAAQYSDHAPTNRAGSDPRDQYPQGDTRNSLLDPTTIRYGDTDTQNIHLMLNSEIVTFDEQIFYIHAFLNHRKSQAGAFFRRSIDPNNDPSIYPDGFLPLIAPKILDYSLTLGTKGVWQNGIKWDLSYTNGYNDFHFYVHNSLNDSLGSSSPTSFDSGGTSYRQQSINLDLSKKFWTNWLIAGGVEYRKESYFIYSGEESSYILGDFSTYAGSQGFPGFQPSNEVDATRTNSAIYCDLRYNLDNRLVLGLASRYENYSDFGSTTNTKLSLAYKPLDALMLRTTASTGFRAPSLSQIYYSATMSGLQDDRIFQTGTFGVNHPVAIALGATPLKPEASNHFSAGFIYQSDLDFSLSADYFYTTIDDRIILRSNITSDISTQVAAILNQYNVGVARYFANAIDTQTQGVDLRLNYKKEFSNSDRLKLTLAYQYNKTKVTAIKTPPSIINQSGTIDEYTKLTLENQQPRDMFKLYAHYQHNAWSMNLHLNRYGSYDSIWGEETFTYSPKWITDMELRYQINPNFSLAVGVNNLFDIYPDKWESDLFAPTIMPYMQYSPFDFNGASYYLRLEGKF